MPLAPNLFSPPQWNNSVWVVSIWGISCFFPSIQMDKRVALPKASASVYVNDRYEVHLYARFPGLRFQGSVDGFPARWNYAYRKSDDLSILHNLWMCSDNGSRQMRTYRDYYGNHLAVCRERDFSYAINVSRIIHIIIGFYSEPYFSPCLDFPVIVCFPFSPWRVLSQASCFCRLLRLFLRWGRSVFLGF